MLRPDSRVVLFVATSRSLGGCYADDVLARNAQAAPLHDAACMEQLAAAASTPRSAACPGLASAAGPIICVGPERAAELADIVAGAAAGTTIVLADGNYGVSPATPLPRLIFRTPGVTLRSASGRAERVVLDGQYATNILIRIAASDISIVDLTLQHALNHAIQVAPDGADLSNTQLYGLRVLDAGNRFIKVDSAPGTPATYADDGSLACSSLELTAEGRQHIQPSTTECDMGGFVASMARGWHVHDNSFRGIYCSSAGVAQHAVHFADGSRDSVVERNHVFDCARGIGFGSAGAAPRRYEDDPYPGIEPISHYAGLIRNNVITGNVLHFDTGIELSQARGARVLHNTIYHPAGSYSSIDYRYRTTAVSLINNIVVRLTARDEGQAEQLSNLEAASAEMFVDVTSGDLHLLSTASAAIDQGSVIADAGHDIDGSPHSVGPPDIGADEQGAP